jgi:hypothetical protein
MSSERRLPQNRMDTVKMDQLYTLGDLAALGG